MADLKKPFSLLARLRSFTFAFRGIIGFFQSEHNAIIHLAATVAVIFMGIWLKISAIEWGLIAIAIGMVFSAELFNSAIEKLADEVTTEIKPSIKAVKDMAAAAVLVMAFIAAIVGLIVFLPPLIEKITSWIN